MAVPDTNTFSLEDVRVDLGLSATASLADCFLNASASQFDPTYEGSKDRLSNFRNYGNCITTFAITLGSGSASTAAIACGQTINQSYWKNNNSSIISGHTIYTNSCGSSVLVGGAQYWSDGSLSFQVSNLGVISNVQFCL